MKCLKNTVASRIGVNKRKRGQEFGVTQSTIHSNWKEVSLKYCKCQKASKYKKSQLDQVAKKCRKLRRQIVTSNIIIVDDEKYLILSNDEILQNVTLSAFDKEHASDNVTYKAKEKYPKNVLVWLALSSKGISTPFIGTTKGSAITVDIYINKCLSKLRSFIEEHHADDEYIFWPDLVSTYYANETTQ